MSNPASALRTAMRDALLANAPLTALLGGAHVFEETPHGAQEPMVVFGSIETRDWSVMDLKAHEHFVTLDIETKSRSRQLADDIVGAIETALDNQALGLVGHRLVNLRLVFWTVQRAGQFYGARLRFRAATEPLP